MMWLQSRIVWAAAALGVLVMVCGFGYVKGHAAGEAVGNARVATLTAQYAQAQANAAADAQAKQTSLQNQIADIDAHHAQELQHAKQDADAVIAGLRAGTLRLRRDWAGCQATAGVSQATAGADQPDAAAERRAESAAAIVRIGAEADAQIRALQAVVKADRQ